MDDNSLSFSQPIPSKNEPVTPVKGTTSTKVSPPPVSDHSSISSIGDRKKEAQILEAYAPQLPMPIQIFIDLNSLTGEVGALVWPPKIGDSKVVLETFNEQMHQITTAMLDSWVSSVRKMAKQSQENRQVNQHQANLRQQLKQARTAANNASEIKGETAAAAAGVLMAGIVALGALPGIEHMVISAPLEPVSEVWQVIAHAVQTIAPTDMASALSAMVSLYGAGLITQTAAVMLKNGEKSKQAFNFDFAKTFASRTLTIVNSASFYKSIMDAFVYGQPKEKALDPKKGELLVEMAKIALLTSSLALVYKVETSSVSAMDVAGLLNRTTKLPEGDPRLPLIEAIHNGLVKLPQSLRLAVLERLFNYFDKNPNAETLTDPSNAIREAFSHPAPAGVGILS